MKHFLITLLILGLAVPPVYAQRGLAKNEGKVSLDFHDVDIQDIVKSISEITGKNFLLDDNVKGKITMMSPKPVSVEEAYQAFLAALEMKRYCAVEDGSITKIRPISECGKGNGDVLGPDRSTERGGEVITRLIPLKYISANEVKQALSGMVSKNAPAPIAYGPTNTLIITDTASSVLRLMKIIEKLDKQNFQAAVEVIPLKFASANDMAEKLTMILEKDKSGGFRTSSRRSGDVEAGADVSKIIPDNRTNSLIVVATREGLGRVLDLLAELDRAVEIKNDQNRVHVRRLDHADATELAQILSALISGTTPAKKKNNDKGGGSMTKAANSALPPGTEPLPWEEDLGQASQAQGSSGSSFSRSSGSTFQDEVHVVAEPATNSLVITAAPADYASLTPIIDELDKRRSQVFVETLIMEVNMKKAVAVGISGHGGGANSVGTAFGASMLGPLNPALISQPGGAAALSGGDPSKFSPVGLVLGGTANQSFKLGGITIPMQGAMFHALQTNSALNILSAPNILTTDNKRAEIIVGDKVPFKTQSVMVQGLPSNTYSREDVGIKLFVTPKVNQGTQVTLDVEQHIQQVQEYGPDKQLGNSERSIKSTIIADSGQTVVIGGLIQDKEEKSVSKVPLLGDIPLLGYLFRENATSREKVNLLVFLTPHVIHDQNDLSRISITKNNERRKFNKKHGIGENQALYDYDLDKGLNMAPAAQEKSRQEITPKRRFNYDESPEMENSSREDDTAVSRRQPRRSEPRSSFAEKPVADDLADLGIKRPRVKRTPGPGGNPFSDVRPPSSQ